MNRCRRRSFRFESLESRAMLAAGILPLDLTVPIDQSAQGFDVVGNATIEANIVILDPSDPSQLSVTESNVGGTGTLEGTFFGSSIVGTYTVSDPAPTYQLTFNPPNLLQIEISTAGTLDLLVDGSIQVPGTFTATVTGNINVVSKVFAGNLRLTAKADGFEQTITVPIAVSDAIADFEIPNASLASIADQVFADSNDNGVKDNNEVGVGGVQISLLTTDDASGQTLASVSTDDEGFYSFYNLPDGPYVVRVDSLPDLFDLGKKDAGDDDSVDGDVNSRSGASDPISVTGSDHLRNIDVALRQVALEWQSPNAIQDVNGDLQVTALDALVVINFMGRNGGAVDLPSNRPIGSAFFDVSGDGRASALDALRVINELGRRSQAASVNAVADALAIFDPRQSDDDPEVWREIDSATLF